MAREVAARQPAAAQDRAGFDRRLVAPMVLGAVLNPINSSIRGKLVVGGFAQVVGCALILLLHGGSAIWLIVLVGVCMGIPQGLNSLANQNAVYHQADPARMGSSAGLLRTFSYLGAIVASAANGAFLRHTAGTTGVHHLAVFMLVVAVLLLVVTLADRSLARVGRTV